MESYADMVERLGPVAKRGPAFRYQAVQELMQAHQLTEVGAEDVLANYRTFRASLDRALASGPEQIETL